MRHPPRPPTASWAACVLLVTAFSLGGAPPAAAQPALPPQVVFQSEALERLTGEPTVYRIPFTACLPGDGYRLVLTNGPDGARRVSSGQVLLNGAAVVEPGDVNPQVESVTRPVALAAANTLEVRLAGGAGGRIRLTVEGDPRCVRVRITAPLPGAVLHEPATVVEGEVEAQGTVGITLVAGVTIRGQVLEHPFPVALAGRRFAAWVPLMPGGVSFRVQATDEAGRSAEDAVSATFTPDPPAYARAMPPEVEPTAGFAPLTVRFGGSDARDPEIDRLDVDVDGDGQPDFTLADFRPPPHAVTHTYPAEGLYVTSKTIRHGPSGVTVSARVPVHVIPRPDLAALWGGFRAALARGDVEAALRLVADESRDRYRRVLENLGADLPAFAASLQDLTPRTVKPGYGTASATRLRDGQLEGFLVHFVRDADGVWRIASL